MLPQATAEQEHSSKMDFRTVIPPLDRQGLVKHGETMLLTGSCFTDNIGQRLCEDLFDAVVNPFGPLYNPLSILRALEALRDKVVVSPDDLFEREGRFLSFMFHSRYSGADREKTAQSMTKAIAEGHEALRKAAVVILTLGTTRVFRHLASDSVVANCHKLPGGEFESRFLTLEETVGALTDCVSLIRECNPEARVIFTVSPLRYLESGAHGNQLIKSTLLLAVNEVSVRFGEDTVSYFPSYEIMMDDLRDYRFYAEDMKHPTPQAVDYIYEIFGASYFTPATARIAVEARALTRRLSHRIMASSLEAESREKMARERAIQSFTGRYPELTDAVRRYYDKNTLCQ